MNLLPLIGHGLQQLDASVTAHNAQLAEKLEQYLMLIDKWNKIYNLTAIRNTQDMVTQHAMDSLAVLPHVKGPHITDVGTGAGLPGIPIALARPDWQVTLVESNQKKTAFLQQAKIELGLHNVTVMAQRIEAADPGRSVSTIISRAFAELGEFITLTRHWAQEQNPDCRWIAMKAKCTEQERQQVQAPFFIEEIVTLTVPGLDADRQLIVISRRSG